MFNSGLVAADVMTRDVATVRPDNTLREVARVLAEKRISGVPVVDENDRLVGIVSEGDLVFTNHAREERHSAWLQKLAEGYDLAPEFLAAMRDINRPVKSIMRTNVITVSETTPLQEIADLMARHAIKRVPVVREGRVVGVVSRLDLVRALARG